MTAPAMPATPHNNQAGKNAPDKSKEGAPLAEHPPKDSDTSTMRGLARKGGGPFLCIYRRRSKFPAEVLDDLENFDATSLFQLCFREENANLFKGNKILYKIPR
jgi:hypothetical protein